MKKIKEILRVLFYPTLLIVVQLGLILVFTFIFNMINNYEIGSSEYIEKLGVFFSNNRLSIVIISFLILIPLFKKKCTFNKINLDLKNIILLIFLGASSALIYNLILFNIDKTYFGVSNSNLIITLLATGIIGPIIEELIFRNIVYEKLKKIYKPLTSAVLTGIIFGIFHGNIIQFIYVFLFNFVLIFVYEKYKSIYAPMIVHVSANCGLQLFLKFVNYNNIYVNIISLIISILTLILSYKILNENKNNC